MILLRTPLDVGCAIRDQRRRLGLDQAELAQRIGVSRKWVIDVEKGKPRAEIGLILRALDALGLRLSLNPDQTPASPPPPVLSVDIDGVLDRLRSKGR
jgi:HTH-type transcriptional regulator/antitoxin HipB